MSTIPPLGIFPKEMIPLCLRESALSMVIITLYPQWLKYGYSLTSLPSDEWTRKKHPVYTKEQYPAIYIMESSVTSIGDS